MRRSKSELRAEFDHVWTIMEQTVAFEKSMDPRLARLFDEHMPEKEAFLHRLERQGETLSGAISGIRMAINDFSQLLTNLMEDDPAEADRFFDFYRAQTGRTYFEDVAAPKTLVRRILARGSIRDDIEFYLVKEMVSNLDGKNLTEAQRAKADRLLDSHEFGAGRGSDADGMS